MSNEFKVFLEFSFQYCVLCRLTILLICLRRPSCWQSVRHSISTIILATLVVCSSKVFASICEEQYTLDKAILTKTDPISVRYCLNLKRLASIMYQKTPAFSYLSQIPALSLTVALRDPVRREFHFAIPVTQETQKAPYDPPPSSK